MSERPPLALRAVQVLVIAALLQTLFVFFFVFPSHDPEPNGFPLAVAGPAPAAEQIEARLAEAGDFDVERVADAVAARELILDREAYGALVLGDRGVRAVLVARAASLPAAQLVEQVGRRAGATTVRDLRPLAEEDPRGITLNVLVLPLIVSSILLALVAINILPELDPRGRLALAAAGAASGGLIAVALVNLWLDALPGPWLAEAGVIALAVMAIALTSAGIIGLIGPAGTAAPFLLFLMLGNPGSGLGSAPELLPSPWHPLGQLLPPGALGSALRGTAYFDGAGVVLPIVVLIAWALLGVALLFAAGRRRAASPPAPAPAH